MGSSGVGGATAQHLHLLRKVSASLIHSFKCDYNQIKRLLCVLRGDKRYREFSSLLLMSYQS